MALLSLAFALNAQAPTAIPVYDEPHHHKIFENSYVRVLRVSFPANESSQLHRHDADYVYVSLGPAEVINAVQGKPEVHIKLADGQVGYTKGGFAHVATAVGIPFNNVTIELLHPQGEPQNRCAQVVPGGSGSICDKFVGARRDSSFSVEPQMETDEMRLDLVKFNSEKCDAALQAESLVVALDESEIYVNLKGASTQVLGVGEVAWIGSNLDGSITNPSKKPMRYLQLSFKDSHPSAKP